MIVHDAITYNDCNINYTTFTERDTVVVVSWYSEEICSLGQWSGALNLHLLSQSSSDDKPYSHTFGDWCTWRRLAYATWLQWVCKNKYQINETSQGAGLAYIGPKQMSYAVQTPFYEPSITVFTRVCSKGGDGHYDWIKWQPKAALLRPTLPLAGSLTVARLHRQRVFPAHIKLAFTTFRSKTPSFITRFSILLTC